MPKYFGMKPTPSTMQVVEKFENHAMIRQKNQILVGTVYLDMQETAWGVAIAYNHSRHPGLRGHENLLEVRYSYMPAQGGCVKMFRSEPGEETLIQAGRFPDPDSFIAYVMKHEQFRVCPVGG